MGATPRPPHLLRPRPRRSGGGVMQHAVRTHMVFNGLFWWCSASAPRFRPNLLCSINAPASKLAREPRSRSTSWSMVDAWLCSRLPGLINVRDDPTAPFCARFQTSLLCESSYTVNSEGLHSLCKMTPFNGQVKCKPDSATFACHGPPPSPPSPPPPGLTVQSFVSASHSSSASPPSASPPLPSPSPVHHRPPPCPPLAFGDHRVSPPASPPVVPLAEAGPEYGDPAYYNSSAWAQFERHAFELVSTRAYDLNELVAPYQLESVSILVLVGLICTGLMSRCCAWRRRRKAVDGPVLSIALRGAPRPRGSSYDPVEDIKLRPDVDDVFDDDNFDDDDEQELD